MPTPTYTVTCTRNVSIARDIYEFVLTKPEGFTFKAGQFVLFDVPLAGNPADIQPRAFSIASAPNERDLLFVAKMKEGGRASIWIRDALKEGSPVVMKGPFGFFTLKPENHKNYLFVATSTGIAPFRAQLLEALSTGDSRRMDIVFGVRSEEDLFWVEELQSLAQQHENVFLHLALSQPSADWKGHRGRVQTLVPLIVNNVSNTHLYLCGSPVMTTELKKLALEQWGMAKEDVHAEGYM